KLGRSVAIKILPELFANDPERVARFEREAKLLASLNHSNIAALYGLEQSDGRHFLIMELVEGSTLSERISQGAAPIGQALKISLQILEAPRRRTRRASFIAISNCQRVQLRKC